MRRLIGVLLLVCVTSGCAVPWRTSSKTVEVWPVLPVPERIILLLPEDDSKVTKDDLLDSLYRTIEYTKKLEMTIEVYNQSAIAHNEKSKEALGLPP